jgi:hypothetical protein
VQYDGQNEIACKIQKSSKGEITGADVICDGNAKVANPRPAHRDR